MPTVIAHRGFSAMAPENTLPAFQQAIEAGADMIECDVRLTADDRLVVIHDATLERTTNGRGAVAHRTLAELRRLEAGAWFDPAFAGTAVPTLDEVLGLCRGRILANLEIKTEDRRPAPLEHLAEAVVERILARGAIRSVVVSSYHRRVVTRVRETEPRLATALLSDRLLTARRLTALARQSGAIALHLPLRLASPQLAAGARQRGLVSAVHTVNERRDMTRILDMGFDAIFTDRPDRLRRLVNQRSRMEPAVRTGHSIGVCDGETTRAPVDGTNLAGIG